MKQPFTFILLICLLACACTDPELQKAQVAEIESLKSEIDSLKSLLPEEQNKIASFLTFQDNNAENAMNFYVDLFNNSEVIEVKRWEEGGPVEAGKVMHATFSLNGMLFMCSDSPPVHAWNFTPAVSNFVQCSNEKEQLRLFTELSKDGSVTMPLDNYGFSTKFGWVIDRYGISWQLNLG